MTFAADERHPAFRRGIELHGEVLQLLGMYFHAHARRALAVERTVDGVPLSPREYECLTWSAQGKSAWAIARILGISPRTVAFHLDNAKEKLGVQTVKQAIARYSASKRALS
jgi:DNA-binding CsgD family transcriptional regulator